MLFSHERLDAASPATVTLQEKELKKKQALDRQARVMAPFQQQQQNFLNSQGAIDWGDDEELSDVDLKSPLSASEVLSRLKSINEGISHTLTIARKKPL